MRWAGKVGCCLLIALVSGCGLDGAPSYSIAGAFFPAWLLCCAIGLVSALLFRVVLVVVKLDDVMPARLLVYTAFGSGLAMWLWLSIFGAG